MKNDKSYAILLIHGFAGTPIELEYLENRLTLEGYPVFAPTLPGHGTTKRALAKTNPKMWLEFIQEELDKISKTPKIKFRLGEISRRYALSFPLRITCASPREGFFTSRKLKISAEVKNIIVIGFSMGGLLSTYLENSPKVSKLIFINTPIWVFNIPIILKDCLIPKKGWLTAVRKYKESTSKASQKSCYQFWFFMRRTRKNFAQIKTPTLIIQSSQDETARPKSGLFINNAIDGSKLIKITGTRHQIFNHSDSISDEVCAHILQFISANN